MLIRFDGSSVRGPSAQLWTGIVDWVRGSLASALGQSDFEDFAPHNPDTSDVDGTTGVAATIVTTERFGVLNLAATAGTNAQVGLARQLHYTVGDSPAMAVEARVRQNADANSPQAFVGLSDVANADDVYAAGAIAAGSNQDTLGLRWNADETIDIVAVVDGTLSVLRDDIGVTVERTSGFAKLGLRVEKVTSTQFRLVPSVNGAIARAGITVVASTALPANPMRPVVATTVAATTAPSLDADYVFTAEK